MEPGIYYQYKDSKTGKVFDEKMTVNLHGIYQGGTNPQTPQVGGNYKDVTDDYSLAPIDETDAAALQHDKDYNDEKIKGFGGIINKKSSKANEDYIKRADKIIEKYNSKAKDNVIGKQVSKKTKDAAEFGKKGFRAAEYLKKELNNKSNEKEYYHEGEFRPVELGEK